MFLITAFVDVVANKPILLVPDFERLNPLITKPFPSKVPVNPDIDVQV